MRRSFNGNYPVTQEFGVYDPVAYGNYPGKKHPGTDYGLPANTELVAGMAGVVTAIDRGTSKTGRGKEVIIAFGNQVRKTCHMNRIDVQTNQLVASGQPIGISGNTGYSTGPHLHDELLIDGQYVDLEKNLNEEDDMSQAIVDDLYKKLDQTNKNVDKLSQDLSKLYKVVDQAQKDIAKKSALPPGQYKLIVE